MALLILLALAFALQFLAGLTLGYYWLLAAVALLVRRSPASPSERPTTRVVILIPAHDEAATIGATLRSCAELDYPSELFSVAVIADNCQDTTAEVVRDHGVRCLERTDPAKRGKGYAVEWGLKSLEPEPFDAVLVLDADCKLQRTALRYIDSHRAAGSGIIQCNNCVENPDDNLQTYALAVGNFVENELFHAPKSRLGLAVYLRGTGMVISKSVLEEVPWTAHSVTEDTQYTLELLLRGHRIAFAREARVLSPFPIERRGLAVQRRRWVGGNLALAIRVAAPTILRGIAIGRIAMADAGWTLICQSKSLFLCELFAATAFAAAGSLLRPGAIGCLAVSISASLFAAFAVYILLGALLMGLNRRRIGLLVRAPAAACDLALAAIRAILLPVRSVWEKTPRSHAR